MVYVYVIQYVCEYVYVIRGKKQSNKVILYVYVYQKQRINKGVRTRYSKKKKGAAKVYYTYTSFLKTKGATEVYAYVIQKKGSPKVY